MESILVSACLLGENCKYNGGNNLCCEVAKLKSRFKLIPVCPECLAGLPIPRVPSEIKDGSVFSKDGRDLTCSFKNGAELALKIAQNNGCKIAVLKERSPSCGTSFIYDGWFNNSVIPGAGITAELLKQNGITVLSEENFNILLD